MGHAISEGDVMLIGFAGRARHGKDWTAAHAQRLLRCDAVTRGFAVELKNRVGRLIVGVPGAETALQEKPAWARAILQAVGENVRQADQDFWVRSLFEWYERGVPRYDGHRILRDVQRHLLIPDVRYPNEVAAIKARGGKVVKVQRWAGAGSLPYRDPNTDPNHPSEALIDTVPDTDFDAIINAGDGMTRWLEMSIEELLIQWGLYARQDGGMGDEL
jgi:hypothetical protein